MTEGDKNILSQSLPLVAVIGLVGFFIWATFEVVREKVAMDSRVTDLDKSVHTLTGSIDGLTVAFGGFNQDRWTRRDMSIWCAKAAAENPGWDCPDPYLMAPEIPERGAGTQWVRRGDKRDAWKPQVGR